MSQAGHVGGAAPRPAPSPPPLTLGASRSRRERLGGDLRCVLYRPHLVRTVATACVVGTVLFLINHLATVLQGHATTTVWVQTGVSFVVPFVVANFGLVVAVRHHVPASVGISLGTTATGGGRPPRWERASQWPRCILYRPHLVRTVTTALVVGTIYFLINQLNNVLHGHATTTVWIETAVTYLVPFTVSNIGVLVGCHQVPSKAAAAPA